jgi:hypothetical protein
LFDKTPGLTAELREIVSVLHNGIPQHGITLRGILGSGNLRKELSTSAGEKLENDNEEEGDEDLAPHGPSFLPIRSVLHWHALQRFIFQNPAGTDLFTHQNKYSGDYGQYGHNRTQAIEVDGRDDRYHTRDYEPDAKQQHPYVLCDFHGCIPFIKLCHNSPNPIAALVENNTVTKQSGA